MRDGLIREDIAVNQTHDDGDDGDDQNHTGSTPADAGVCGTGASNLAAASRDPIVQDAALVARLTGSAVGTTAARAAAANAVDTSFFGSGKKYSQSLRTTQGYVPEEYQDLALDLLVERRSRMEAGMSEELRMARVDALQRQGQAQEEAERAEAERVRRLQIHNPHISRVQQERTSATTSATRAEPGEINREQEQKDGGGYEGGDEMSE